MTDALSTDMGARGAPCHSSRGARPRRLATQGAVWMAHCHIAEHHDSAMMFSFDVTP